LPRNDRGADPGRAVLASIPDAMSAALLPHTTVDLPPRHPAAARNEARCLRSKLRDRGLDAICDLDRLPVDEPRYTMDALAMELTRQGLEAVIEPRMSVRQWIADVLSDPEDDAPIRALRLATNERLLMLSKLGHGGFGDVWLAGSDTRPSAIAAKCAKHDASARPRDEEADILRALRLPCVPRFIARTEVRGRGILCCERVEGASWKEVLRPWEEMALTTLFRVFLDAATSLASLHARGIVHGDVKPGNLMLGRDRKNRDLWRTWIVDFGLSRRAHGGNAPLAADLAGTHGYIDPWTIGRVNERDASSDVYALGATFHEWYAGKALWTRDTWAEALQRRGSCDEEDYALWWNDRIMDASRAWRERRCRHGELEDLLLSMLRYERQRADASAHIPRPTMPQVVKRLAALPRETSASLLALDAGNDEPDAATLRASLARLGV